MPPKLLLRITLYGCAALATLAASLPQPREGEISLALSIDAPPAVIDGVSDFILAGTLKNDGPQDILVVKDPNGILYEFFTADALDFEKANSNAKSIIKPSFVGYRAKWDLKHYLQNEEEEDEYLPDDHKDVVSLTSSGKSLPNSGRRRGSSEDSEDDSTPLSDTESSVGGISKSEDNTYPPDTTLTLLAGQTINFNYKVGNAYDFSKSGAGAYTFKLKRDYFYVLVDNVVKIAKVKVGVKEVDIQGKLKAEVPNPRNVVRDTNYDNDPMDLEGRNIVERARTRKTSVTTRGCGKIRTSIIDLAAQHANRYAAESNHYMSAMTGPTERYEHWFGKWNTGPKAPYEWRPRDQVAAMYKSLSKHSFLHSSEAGGYTYDCACNERITAYVMSRVDSLPPDVDNPAIIYLCKGFRARNRPMVGTDSKAGTLIHEATHVTYHLPDTDDHSVFYENCERLAINNPFHAATNGDSYEYFSENNPFRA